MGLDIRDILVYMQPWVTPCIPCPPQACSLGLSAPCLRPARPVLACHCHCCCRSASQLPEMEFSLALPRVALLSQPPSVPAAGASAPRVPPTPRMNPGATPPAGTTPFCAKEAAALDTYMSRSAPPPGVSISPGQCLLALQGAQDPVGTADAGASNGSNGGRSALSATDSGGHVLMAPASPCIAELEAGPNWVHVQKPASRAQNEQMGAELSSAAEDSKDDGSGGSREGRGQEGRSSKQAESGTSGGEGGVISLVGAGLHVAAQAAAPTGGSNFATPSLTFVQRYDQDAGQAGFLDADVPAWPGQVHRDAPPAAVEDHRALSPGAQPLHGSRYPAAAERTGGGHLPLQQDAMPTVPYQQAEAAGAPPTYHEITVLPVEDPVTKKRSMLVMQVGAHGGSHARMGMHQN